MQLSSKLCRNLIFACCSPTSMAAGHSSPKSKPVLTLPASIYIYILITHTVKLREQDELQTCLIIISKQMSVVIDIIFLNLLATKASLSRLLYLKYSSSLFINRSVSEC